MRRLRVELSPPALLDLEDIADFIARDNPKAALRWVDLLVKRAQRVGAVPRSGRVVPEIGDPDIREVRLRTYRIILSHRGPAGAGVDGHRGSSTPDN